MPLQNAKAAHRAGARRERPGFPGATRGARSRIALVLAAVAVVVPLAAGCGGDDEPEQTTAPAVTDPQEMTAPARDTGGKTEPANEPAEDPETDRAAVEATLRQVLTTADPGEACGDLVTERYVRRSFGDRNGCAQAQAQAAAAKRVTVARVVVSPKATAQASVRVRGGVYDGQRLRAELVLEDGLWRLDSIRSNVPVGP